MVYDGIEPFAKIAFGTSNSITDVVGTSNSITDGVSEHTRPTVGQSLVGIGYFPIGDHAKV